MRGSQPSSRQEHPHDRRGHEPAANGADTPTLNHTVSALRFFFRVTLKRYAIVEHTTFIHEPRKLPVVLSPEEVARLLNAASALKSKRR